MKVLFRMGKNEEKAKNEKRLFTPKGEESCC
jgi:hypothetical protein